MQLAATMRPDQHLLVNLSGRGDKDIATVAELDAKRARERGRARMSRIDATFAALRDRQAHGAHSLRHRRRSASPTARSS